MFVVLADSGSITFCMPLLQKQERPSCVGWASISPSRFSFWKFVDLTRARSCKI